MLKRTMKSDNLIFLNNIPRATSDSEMGIEDLKTKVLDIIVEYSLYKDSELDILFDEVERKNSSIVGKDKVRNMTLEIRNILDD